MQLGSPFKKLHGLQKTSTTFRKAKLYVCVCVCGECNFVNVNFQVNINFVSAFDGGDKSN